MNYCPPRNRNALRLLAGWCGLLLYVGAFSPCGMGVVALFGAIDPDHRAILQPANNGMRLVLQHDDNGTGHHHGTLARALTMFAQPASRTDPDHVLQFSSATGFPHESQLIVPAASQLEPIPVNFAEPFSFITAGPIQFCLSAHPPPGANGTVLPRRSTELLI